MPLKKYSTEAERKAARVAAVLRHRAKNRERFDVYQTRYRKEHPEKVRSWNRKAYYTDVEATRAAAVERRTKLRMEVAIAYGAKCQCCGEAEPGFLTVDHIAGYKNMMPDQRGPRGGTQLYYWLRAHGFPKEGFQLLCMNCNTARSWFGACPHERNRKLTEE